MDLEGLTFDWINNKIYYASRKRIYASNADGTGVHTVFASAQYGYIRGLAFDWITGNLYGVAWNGQVFVCASLSRRERLTCTDLLTGQGNLNGIALDANNGKMYWTRCLGDIMGGQMDGSDAVQVVTGLSCPAGIAVDYGASRIFWTEMAGNKICSSNLDGTDVRIIVPLPSGTEPWGIALHNDQMYWAAWNASNVQRSSKSGQDIQLVSTGTRPIQQLATTSWNYPISRPNNCKDKCSNICVLTTKNFRCLRRKPPTFPDFFNF